MTSEGDKFTAFEDGLLKSGDSEWKLPFKARIDKTGALEFEVERLKQTDQTFEIEKLWHQEKGTFHQFTLAGTAEDGTTFSTDTLFINGITSSSDETGSWLDLRVRCNVGCLRHPLPKPPDKITVRECWRGFEAFGPIHAACPLGEVNLAGMTKLPDDESLSGYIHIANKEMPADIDQWRANVVKLFEHVRNVMSLAQSRTIKAPVRQSWIGPVCEVEAFSQRSVSESSMQVFHHLNLQPIFDIAVSSFFNPPIDVKKLHFAIEWFAMPAYYSETRLLNAMTALENLANANLSDEDKRYLDEAPFDKISKTMRKAFVPNGPAETTLRNTLASKMLDLNRKTLKEKVLLLADRWKVPLHDMEPGALGAAIVARNEVVHRGHYYDDEAPEEKEKLWTHILVAREIVVRFLLTALGFKGKYISFLGGGYHDADFPPPPLDESDASV